MMMRPRSRNDVKGMSPKKPEGSTRSPDNLNMKDRAELEKMSKLRRASARTGRERAIMANDPRLPGAAERKAADREEANRIYNLMFGEDEPVKKAYGGKMKKVKKMGSGGNVCRGMGAAKRGGNFVKG
tara:strand:- start:1714 stop:2097 length:384 start_codon:yes stop_codon:yes gene_type:complete